jgi:glycosyltransferase involved in cell wall biosynthesis
MMIDRPLRFCMITTFYPPYNFGGDGIFVQRLSNELAERGHHVEVIHSIDAYRLLAGAETSGNHLDHPNVTIHGLASPLGILSSLATHQTGTPLFESRRIREILAPGFDVIHYHNISLVGGPRILEFGSAVKLYTLHEYWLLCPNHVLVRFKRAVCQQPHCFLCSLTYKRPPQWWRYSGVLKHMLKHVDMLIAPSRFSQGLHRQAGFDVPIVHLPNFVPATRVTQARGKARQLVAEPYFLYVGRLEHIKGVQTLFPLFRRLPGAQLLIAGRGGYGHQLRQLAEGSANIHFLGHQTGEQLQALYREAVAVIIPSLWYEVSPQVAIESFQEQTPIVVRNLGGMREIIEASGGGFTFTSEEELQMRLEQLLANPLERDALGQRGFQTYKREWTVQVHLQRYLTLIDEIARTRTR